MKKVEFSFCSMFFGFRARKAGCYSSLLFVVKFLFAFALFFFPPESCVLHAQPVTPQKGRSLYGNPRNATKTSIVAYMLFSNTPMNNHARKERMRQLSFHNHSHHLRSELIAFSEGFPSSFFDSDFVVDERSGMTFFQAACFYGYKSIVKKMIKKRFERKGQGSVDNLVGSTLDKNGASPIFYAVRGRRVKIVALLLKKANVDVLKKERGDNNSIIHEAVIAGSLPILKVLLSFGFEVYRNYESRREFAAIVDAHNFRLENPIFIAIYNRRFDLAEEILSAMWKFRDSGIYIYPLNKRLKSGNNCLGLLISKLGKNFSSDQFNFCLYHGTDLKMINGKGESLVTVALRNDRFDIAKFLVERCGLDVEMTNGRYMTQLEAELSRKDPSLSAVRGLLELGADPNANTSNGKSLMLMEATSKNRRPFFELLVDYGARFFDGEIWEHADIIYRCRLNYYINNLFSPKKGRRNRRITRRMIDSWRSAVYNY